MDICRRCGQIYTAHINGIVFPCRDEQNHDWVEFEHMPLTYAEQKELRREALQRAIEARSADTPAKTIVETAAVFYEFLQADITGLPKARA